jgi:hypothetical protein
MKISFHHHRSEASYSWSHSHALAQLIPSRHVTYTTMSCVCVLCYPPIIRAEGGAATRLLIREDLYAALRLG